MRHTVYKVYLATQYEQEEKWLNEMSSRGLALIHTGIFRYIFEDETPGKYTYKIELLDHMPSSAASRSYLQFLEDAGIRHVGSIFRWVYLRKDAADGPFSLYSDLGSSIKYFRRLQIFFIVLTFFEFFIGIQNLVIGAFTSNGIRMINIIMGLLLMFIGVLLAIAAYQHTKKLQLLKRESRIRE